MNIWMGLCGHDVRFCTCGTPKTTPKTLIERLDAWRRALKVERSQDEGDSLMGEAAQELRNMSVNARNVVPNSVVLMFVRGWQGGTVHQIAAELGVTTEDIHGATYERMGELMRLAQEKRQAAKMFFGTERGQHERVVLDGQPSPPDISGVRGLIQTDRDTTVGFGKGLDQGSYVSCGPTEHVGPAEYYFSAKQLRCARCGEVWPVTHGPDGARL